MPCVLNFDFFFLKKKEKTFHLKQFNKGLLFEQMSFI